MVHSEGMFSILDYFSRMSVHYAQLRQHECPVFMPLTAESAVCVDKKEINMLCIFNFPFTFCVLVGRVQKLIVVKLESSTFVSF